MYFIGHFYWILAGHLKVRQHFRQQLWKLWIRVNIRFWGNFIESSATLATFLDWSGYPLLDPPPLKKARPLKTRCFQGSWISGGELGIWTLVTLTRKHDFQQSDFLYFLYRTFVCYSWRALILNAKVILFYHCLLAWHIISLQFTATFRQQNI